jgi:hypothetical protein
MSLPEDLNNNFIKKKIKKVNKHNWIWGIGIEHEMHVFHKPDPNKKAIKEIILAPTEKRVFDIMNNLEKFKEETKKIFKSSSLEEFLDAIPFETTGRKCNGKVVINYLPSTLRKGESEKMPEFITGFPFHEIKFEDYIQNLENTQNKFFTIIKRLKYSNSQINRYGRFTSYPFGMSSYIKMPKDCKSKYTFNKNRYTDYTGSYHITMTLPFTKKTTTKKFIEKHQNFANQLQWIEPLLLTAFFSADDKCMGTAKKKVKGSFRVMKVGWGNFAGSDVSKFNKGIGRYANIKSYWRDGLIFDEIEKLRPCYPPSAPARREGGISTLSSNFRTFGSTDPKRPDHRVSGAPMTKPNGIEIRIFDHFKIEHLLSLCRLITYVAENSRNFKTKNYVYKNKAWKEAMHSIMEDGWCALLDESYINELRKNLNLKIKTKSIVAYDILDTIYIELYKKNSKGLYSKLLLKKKPTKKIKELPKINMDSWEFGFLLLLNNNKKVLNNINKIIKDINIGKSIDIEEFTKIYFKYMTKRNWNTSLTNIIYFLLNNEIILIEKKNNGTIKSINCINFKIINKVLINQKIDKYFDDINKKTLIENIILNKLKRL